MADLYLSGVVGYDITERQVLDFLNENDDKDLNIFINSPGGSVFEGMGIYNILRNSGRNITTINNGLAASMGSILFLAGDTRIANTGSIYMVHKPSSIAWGNADDMKKEAEVLDKVQDSLANIYKERTGIENINDYINEATWWDVDEMIEKGVAHSERKKQGNEGDVEDMAKIDDLKAEKEKLEAEKAQLEEKLEEARLEADINNMKADIAKMEAVAEKKSESDLNPETKKGIEKDNEPDDETDTDSELEEDEEVETVDKPEPVKKTAVIDTTNTVAKKLNNKIPAFMQVESKY